MVTGTIIVFVCTHPKAFKHRIAENKFPVYTIWLHCMMHDDAEVSFSEWTEQVHSSA